MDHSSSLEKILRSVAITLVLVFFLFPIAWIFLMSLQTNETILSIPPSLAFTPIIDNYTALITGQLRTAAGSLQLNFMQNMFNSVLLSVCSVALSLVLGVPAAYAFARSSSGWARTSPSRCCPSASRPHFWCCYRSASISRRSASPTPTSA